MQTNHVAIWIDHKEAHILYFDASKNEFIKSDASKQHLHHKANAIGSGKTPIDHEFFHKVISAVASVKEILDKLPALARQHGLVIESEAPIRALCEKKLIELLGDFLVNQPAVTQVPVISIVYK